MRDSRSPAAALPQAPRGSRVAESPACGRVSCRLTWLLALLATLTFEVASADADHPVWMIALTVACEAALVGILSMIAMRFDSGAERTGNSRLIWILCLANGAFAVELLLRGTTNSMLPMELLLLAYFRDAVLALAVFAFRADCQRVCCSLSTFLTIFASALSTHLWLHGLVVVFAMTGIWWLMGTYWDSLRDRLVATSERDFSRRWLIGLPLLVLALLLCLPALATQTHAFRGFMPSSGGSDQYSDAARSGVGDGDALVAGTEHIQSFAPIDDAPFLSSHEPSLYDVFDDAYNEPVKPSQQDRAIGLAPELAAKQKDHHLAESRRAGKQFSTVRKLGKPKLGTVRDRDSDAVLYVKGRVPLHLKLEVFDQFDGVDWIPEQPSETELRLEMETLHGRPWLRLRGRRALEVYATPEVHALKIIRLDTNRVPAPTQLLGVHIDKLDRVEFYTWAQPGVVRMDRKKLPALTTMQVQSRAVDERLIPGALAHLTGGPAAYRQIGTDAWSRRVRELAGEWTQEIPDGWPRVRAIVDRLRGDYIHDPTARPPAGCHHAAGHFLLESRRGPDYQFASAAVLLLRSLGYSARLVSGFYAAPSRYEARSRETPVLIEDIHFWAEVRAGTEDWLPIEPTPGYELLRPPPTLIEQLQAAVLTMWRMLVTNILWIAVCAAGVSWAFVQRRLVADRVATAHWRCFPARDARCFVRQTLRLLDARSRRAGRGRPPGMTPTRWLERCVLSDDSVRPALVEFSRLADWASFSPPDAIAPTTSLVDVCHAAVRAWSWRKLVQAASPTRNHPIPQWSLIKCIGLPISGRLLRKIAE